jgi:hypothetical protein
MKTRIYLAALAAVALAIVGFSVAASREKAAPSCCFPGSECCDGGACCDK